MLCESCIAVITYTLQLLLPTANLCYRQQLLSILRIRYKNTDTHFIFSHTNKLQVAMRRRRTELFRQWRRLVSRQKSCFIFVKIKN